jgi:hypothetical protein
MAPMLRGYPVITVVVLSLPACVLELEPSDSKPEPEPQPQATPEPVISGTVTVEGTFRFARPPASAEGATARIRLRDDTYEDAPAPTIATTVMTGFDPSGLTPFRLVGSVDPNKRYAVSVFVDMNGDDTTSLGDHWSMQSYPVVTDGWPRFVEVVVHPIE